MRHHHRLATHIGKSVLLHLGEHPVDRLLERRGSAESMPEPVDQCAESAVWARISKRRGGDATGDWRQTSDIGGSLRVGRRGRKCESECGTDCRWKTTHFYTGRKCLWRDGRRIVPRRDSARLSPARYSSERMPRYAVRQLTA